MTARIFFKLIFAVLLVMAVALTTIDYLASRLAEDAYVRTLAADMSEKTRMLALLGESGVLTRDREATLRLAHAAGGRLTFIAGDGRVLFDSEADSSHMENHLNRPEIQAALKEGTGVSRRHSPTTGRDFLYVATRTPSGVVRLARPLEEVSTQITAMRKTLLGYTMLAFLPGILLAAFFARYFSRRLGAIIDYASTLATGNFRARLHYSGEDELGVLARQLNETGSKLRKMFEELQREHQELEKLERVRKDFVINVSHELRTPLASIQGYTETLLDGAIDDKQHNLRFLQIIRQNAERLTRLTADLLTLSRIEMRNQKFQFASYRLGQILADACDSLRPVAAKKNIRITLDPVPGDVEVFCDAEAVSQVLSNLLDNAIKYSPESGHVRVSHRVLTGFVEISVADTGIGIPAADLPRLFERFYRVDKARSRELGGTGLGLAIVKHLVRSHGGEVSVESVPNQGSTFRFTLPTEDPGVEDNIGVQDQFTKL